MDHIVCPGFKSAGISAGIKKTGAWDLGLIYSEVPAAVAGLFTKNLVKAAPVLLDMERVKSGSTRAVMANSGNANCCNGEDGLANAKAMARYAAKALGIDEEDVLVASTGVIGMPFPAAKVEKAAPELVKALKEDGLIDCARAIMTTDTVPKCVSVTGEISGKTFTIAGIAKGAGMIRPDMATMLSFLCTDAKVSADNLKAMLLKAADKSYNSITIDGDTSTNDTVLIMANGLSGISVESDEEKRIFQKKLDEITLALAEMLVKDGEGVTKTVRVTVTGAPSDEGAFRVADAVAHSYLVKTAFFGEDANWGRIMAAAGRAGVNLDPSTIDITFDHVPLVKQSRWLGPEAEVNATKILKKSEFSVTVDLHCGDGESSILTCDLSIDYVKINADYRS